MKRLYEEFKEFINRGNLLGIAIGFVMGVAFTGLITSFVDNIVMPIVAIPFGEPNFDDALVWNVNGAEIRFGAFLTTLVTFLLIALVVFFLLKAYNKAMKQDAAAPLSQNDLLAAIRDELQGMRGDLRNQG